MIEPRALLVYGTALFNGDGVEPDLVKAYAYVSRAAAQGLAPAKETLAQMDELIPLEDRQKGVALALAAAKSPSAPKAASKVAPPKTVAAPKPKVVVAVPKPTIAALAAPE